MMMLPLLCFPVSGLVAREIPSRRYGREQCAREMGSVEGYREKTEGKSLFAAMTTECCRVSLLACENMATFPSDGGKFPHPRVAGPRRAVFSPTPRVSEERESRCLRALVAPFIPPPSRSARKKGDLSIR